MNELSYLFTEIISILSINIIIVVYSFISSDQLTSMICFTIYIVLLTPLLLVLEKFKSVIFLISYDQSYLKLMISTLFNINFIVGIFLFIQIIYLFFFS
jgi:hypothetical protein